MAHHPEAKSFPPRSPGRVGMGTSACLCGGRRSSHRGRPPRLHAHPRRDCGLGQPPRHDQPGPAGATPSPRPSAALGERLGLGTRTTLNQAQARLAWQDGVPSMLGGPDEGYLQQPPTGPSGGEVTLDYAQRTDIPVSGLTGVSVLVTEARGRVDEIFFQKTVGSETTVEQVTVGGHPAYWISGHPHDFAFVDASGNVYGESLRLATNTLIFDHNGTIVRIEGDMTRAQALQIANSI